MGCGCSNPSQNYSKIQRSREDSNSVLSFFRNSRRQSRSNGQDQSHGVPLREVIMVLNRTHLFRHLPKDEDVHLILAEACEIQDYEPNQDIVKQGDVGDAFFAIRAGRVSVTIDGKKVDTWRVGADFGEHSLLHDEPRHATIRTETCVSVLVITRAKFWQLGLNNMLQFEGRKAIKGGIDVATKYDTTDVAKTPAEYNLIRNALVGNQNLQAMVTLDEKRIQQLVEHTWKHHVQAGTEIIAEGDLADCFWIVQSGSFRRLHGGAASSTEGPAEQEAATDSQAETTDFDISEPLPKVERQESVRTSLSHESCADSAHSENSPLQVKGKPQKDRGQVVRVRSPRQARRHKKAHILAGDSFGEVALLYNVPRAKTVVAHEDSVLWGIDRKDFKEILLGRNEERWQKYMQYLSTVPCLKDLLPDEKRELAQALVEMHFVRGENVTVQGESQDQCHILFEGEVVVLRDGVEEQRLSANGSHRSGGVPCCFAFWGGKGNAKTADIRCYTFGEDALADDSNVHSLTVRVVSEKAQTVALFKDTFKLLVGDLGKLERIRKVRSERRLSMRSAVNRVAFEDMLKKPLQSRYAQFGQIPSNTLKKVNVLGSGAFGNVELWKDRQMNQYACKIMSKGHIASMNAQRNVINERNVMFMTQSPFVVRLLEVYNAPTTIYFLMEFVNGGELYTVYNRLGLHGQIKYAKFYTACVVCAFEHLHGLHIIYRDLKPENLLLDSRGYLKLADMGLATFAIGVTHTFCGTTDYMAPEIIKNCGHTNAVDWWTLGILIFELLCGSPPFESADPMQTYKSVMKGIDYVRFPAKCQGAAEDLIKSLLRKYASDRLPMRPGGLRNLTSHRWYKEYDWISLREQRLDPPNLPPQGNRHQKFNAHQKSAPVAPHFEDDHDFWEINAATCPWSGLDDTPSVNSDDQPRRRASNLSQVSKASTTSKRPSVVQTPNSTSKRPSLVQRLAGQSPKSNFAESSASSKSALPNLPEHHKRLKNNRTDSDATTSTSEHESLLSPRTVTLCYNGTAGA